MSSGAATTTVYPSSISDDVAFILGDSGSRVAFAEDAVQLGKLREHRDELPDLVAVVTFDADAAAGEGAGDGWAMTLDELESRGDKLLLDNPHVVKRTHRRHP